MANAPAGRVRILHVDDDPELGEIAAAFLEEEHEEFRVTTETDPSEALDRLTRAEFDCIVSDYEMPGLDGIEFLRRVRKTRPDTPFILFTGKGSEEVASEAVSAGATDYLQKEVGTEQYELLANRIDHAVSEHRAERQARNQARRLALLRDLNQALVKSNTVAEIETRVTEILASADPYQGAWIGEYDGNHEEVIPRTAVGLAADSLEPVAVSEGGSDAGIVPEALETGDVSVTEEPDPTLEVWSEDDDRIDYAAATTLPIVYHGDRHGVLALYSRDPQLFAAAERDMLDEIAGDIAHAIDAAKTRERLQRHRTAVEAVPEGVFILDDDATIVEINDSVATLFEYDATDIEGERFPRFVEEGIFDEDIVEWYLSSVRDMLSSSTETGDARYETDVTLSSGEGRTVEVHLSLRPYDEEFRGTVGIIRDVTEARRRERELEESKDRYRRLVETAPVPIVLYDAGGEIVYCNEAAVTFIDAESADELVGTSALEFVHPEDREFAASRVQTVLDERRPVPATELSLLDRSDDRKEVILSSVPVSYENAPAGQVVLKDVTEMKARERELQRQRDRLDEFASIVTHDLRSPLSVATGRLALARDECDSDHLDAVAQAHARLDALIDDLRTFARTGKGAMELEDVGLSTLATECWQTVETAEASLVTETDLTVRADRGLLRQALENIIRNAVEHGREDGVVTIGALPDEGFYIEDDGPGIPVEDRDSVFEYGVTRKADGTGLGLAIVREIVDAHDWTIAAAESDAGGARFEITDVELDRDSRS